MLKALKIAAVACMALAPTTLFAAPIATGTYSAQDYDEFRSIWTPFAHREGGNSFVKGNDTSGYYSFEENSRFIYDGSNARLVGTATNTGNENVGFDFDLRFAVIDSADADPYRPSNGDVSMWTFFRLTSGMLTGLNDIAGVDFDIEVNTSHGPQAGVGANPLDQDLGFSMWFHYFLKQGSNTAAAQDAGYSIYKKGNGDINIDIKFVDGGTGGVVPLPAAAWMLLAGLGALGAVGRRKKA